MSCKSTRSRNVGSIKILFILQWICISTDLKTSSFVIYGDECCPLSDDSRSLWACCSSNVGSIFHPGILSLFEVVIFLMNLLHTARTVQVPRKLSIFIGTSVSPLTPLPRIQLHYKVCRGLHKGLSSQIYLWYSREGLLWPLAPVCLLGRPAGFPWSSQTSVGHGNGGMSADPSKLP